MIFAFCIFCLRIKSRRSLEDILPAKEILDTYKTLSMPSNSNITGKNDERIFSKCNIYVSNTYFYKCFSTLNTPSNGNGGAVSMKNGQLYFIGCTFINNSASNSGGSIYAIDSCLIVYKSSFVGDQCNKNGGSIYVSMSNPNHEMNSDINVQVDSCKFYETYSRSNDGGAIYSENITYIYINIVNFTSCSAQNGNGGAIALIESSIQMFTSHFMNTSSKSSVIYFDNINKENDDLYVYIEDCCFAKSYVVENPIYDLFISGKLTLEYYANCFTNLQNCSINREIAIVINEYADENIFSVSSPDQQRYICDLFTFPSYPDIPVFNDDNGSIITSPDITSSWTNTETTISSIHSPFPMETENDTDSKSTTFIDYSITSGNADASGKASVQLIIILVLSITVIFIVIAIIIFIIIRKKRAHNIIMPTIEDVILDTTNDFHNPIENQSTSAL